MAMTTRLPRLIGLLLGLSILAVAAWVLRRGLAPPPPTPARPAPATAPPGEAAAPGAPADLPAEALWVEDPPDGFDRAFAAHAAEAAPQWARLGAVLDQSDQPPLAAVSRDIAAQLGQPPTDDAGRRDLLMAQRQLLAVLESRYAGAQVMDAELAALRRSLAAVDAAGGVLAPGAAPPP